MREQQALFSYQHHEDEQRGRCLIATSDFIQKGRLLFAERPVVAMQSIGNSFDGALVCSYCMAFCGTPKQALCVASDPSLLQEITTSNVDNTQSEKNKKKNSNNNKVLFDKHTIHFCRHNCGHIYCCIECQQDDWTWGGHRELCTGSIPQDESAENVEEEQEDQEIDDNKFSTMHPLLRFKIHARETNEIFLLVATWLIRIIKHDLPYCEDDKMHNHPYTDFQMNPWWDVKSAEALAQGSSVVEAKSLESTLKDLCKKSHSYLSQALFLIGEETTLYKNSPWLSPKGIARLIGSLEQNCLGIRRKHALQHDIVQDTELRHELHTELIQCLEQMRDENDSDCGCDDDDDDQVDDNGTSTTNDDIVESEYSYNDVANILASMATDVASECNYNELDDLCRPLDGIAHFSTASKMNHSCDPSVVLIYKTRGWGRDHPLVAYCIALKDIKQGEELTISYIASDDPYDERQRMLANYGFICTCYKCIKEIDAEIIAEEKKICIESTSTLDGEELFGEDDDNDDDNDDDDNSNNYPKDNESDSSTGSPQRENNIDEQSGEKMLQNVTKRLKSVLNSSNQASIPIAFLAQASNFVIKEAHFVVQELRRKKGNESEKILENLLEQNIHALKIRDFASCRIVGSKLERRLFEQLQAHGSWSNSLYRESYWFASITSSIGYANDGSFLVSMKYLDKAIILGLDSKKIELHFGYVEHFASQMAFTPCPIAVECKIADYHCPRLKEMIINFALSKPILFPVEMIIENPSCIDGIHTSINQSNVCAVRGLASAWKAVKKWRGMDALAREFGHRLVPIEIGSMGTRSGMKESLVTFRSFVSTFLSPSATREFWSLENAIADTNNIAYLAQHPLLDQIIALKADIDTRPCGIQPTNINVWIGTGGTRTPLHFDSYDNLLVQIVGAKYVRLYDKNSSRQLYVSKNCSYGAQGNMSDVDCERENYEKHPLAKDCDYKEIVLLPGDCLFIPSHHWHYVRSLSTSISINYWF